MKDGTVAERTCTRVATLELLAGTHPRNVVGSADARPLRSMRICAVRLVAGGVQVGRCPFATTSRNGEPTMCCRLSTMAIVQ